jgi:hypothetical protein
LDLYTRLRNNLKQIKKATWTNLGLKENELFLYDEFLMCQKQASQTHLTEEEKSVINPILTKLKGIWELVAEVENITSILEFLKSKHHNTFSNPKEDLKVIFDAIERYLKLKEKYPEDEKKIDDLVYNNIVFLKSKIILPEIDIKYPSLFK